MTGECYSIELTTESDARWNLDEKDTMPVGDVPIA